MEGVVGIRVIISTMRMMYTSFKFVISIWNHFFYRLGAILQFMVHLHSRGILDWARFHIEVLQGGGTQGTSGTMHRHATRPAI